VARVLAVVVSACPSVTSRFSTETAKRKMTQTTPHDSFLMPKISTILKLGHPNGGAKCRWGRLNAREVAENWRLSMRSVVNVTRSQVYHTERPPDLFAACSL